MPEASPGGCSQLCSHHVVQGAEILLRAPQRQQKEGQVTGELGLEGEYAGEGRQGAGVGLDPWACIRDHMF